jgi:hypothetical protein
MSAQVTITQLPTAGAITGTEAVPIVQNGVTVQTTTAALAGSPVQTYTYLTVTQTPQLANSRYVGVTNGLTITDGGAQGLFNISSTGALLSLVNSGTGFQVKTSSTAITPRSITVSGTGLSITNGSGVSGNPDISLSGAPLNLANLSANGLLTVTTAGGVGAVTLQGTASQIDVSFGNAVGGSPTVALANNPIIPGAASATLPAGSTADRPASAADGMIRYNTQTDVFEGYINGAWAIFASNIDVSSFSGGTTGFTPSSPTTGPVVLDGILNVLNGGTGTATPSLVAGTNVTITGTWPNQTIDAITSSGTVTSVSFTGGIVSVATATTTPALTVAGTSGGIPYFSSASTWASSAALTQYGVVYGGGAGATPVATAAGTTGQVLTATTGGAPTWASPATSGTVTSVAQSFTGGLISVAGSPITSSGTLALTVAGTSGGVPYFSSGTTWATSAALAANAIVLGGGAGAAPATTTTGTGVVTALGVNT